MFFLLPVLKMDRRHVTLLHSFYPSVFRWGLWSQWEEMPTELQYVEDAQHRSVRRLQNGTKPDAEVENNPHIHNTVVFPAWENHLI